MSDIKEFIFYMLSGVVVGYAISIFLHKLAEGL